jgi:MFS family permease
VLYLLTPLLAFTGPLWGWVADRVSRPLVLSVRGFANTASALIYLVAPNLAGMWLGKSLDDLGKAAFRPAWGSLMADISSQDRRKRARIMGYLTAGEDAGDIAAPILAGLLWTGFGVPAVLLARVGLAVMAEAYTLWLEHHAPASGRRGGRHRARRSAAGRGGGWQRHLRTWDLGAAPVPVDRYPVEVRALRHGRR